MDQPLKVSIVINNYNYGRFIAEAIDSALAQTYANVEVIVVDDGSTDDSRRAIEGYGDKVCAIFKTNGGQASALNAGFAASTGDLILFLDSDDVLLPGAAETVAREWRQGLSLVYFPLEVIDANGLPLGRTEGGLPIADPGLGPFSPGSPTSGNVFARDLLAGAMPIPEEHWRVCADSYLVGASRLIGPVKLLPALLAKYRVHEKNNFAHKEQGLAEIRRSLSAGLALHECLHRIAEDKVVPIGEWLGANPQHWVARITSLRECPHDHPWPDTLPGLAARAIRAAWRQPYWNFRKKAAYTILIACYSVASHRLARALRRMERLAGSPQAKRILGRTQLRARSQAPRRHAQNLVERALE